MPRCSFSFGQVEDLLASMHHIAPDRRSAFQGRLKHLQRWGFPTDERPGKGKAISYTVEHVFRAVLALELIQAGINPKFAVEIINSNWVSALRTTVYLNSFTGTERVKYGAGSADDWFWLVRPEALRSMTEAGEHEFDKHEAINPVSASNLASMLGLDAIGFSSVLGAHWRTLVINGGPLVRGVLFVIEHQFTWATRDDMISDLRDALELETARRAEFSEKFGPGLRQVARNVRANRLARQADEYPFLEAHPELIPRAQALLDAMPPGCAEALSQPEGAVVEFTDTTLKWLADRRLVLITAQELAVTPLGFVTGELIRKARNDGNPQA